MPRFFVWIGTILLFDALLLALLAWAYRSPRLSRWRISRRPGIKVRWSARLRTMALISTLSLAAVLGPSYVLYDRLMLPAPEAMPLWRVAVDALAILTLYDVAYYWLHRAMHHKRLMRWVHGVHHRARNPSALESFYLHPLELLAGLALLFGSALVVGPVAPAAFLIAFAVYSTLNILIHSGLDIPSAWLGPINFLTRKHHVHHQDDFGKNFSSLTPIPDLLFGTAG